MVRIEMVHKCIHCLNLFACSVNGVKTLCTNCPNYGTTCIMHACNITHKVCPECLTIVTDFSADDPIGW